MRLSVARRRARTQLAVTTLTVLGLVLGGAASPVFAQGSQASAQQRATSLSYVALGDSFTAGQGAPPYTGGPCLRSQRASYPAIAAAVSGYTLVANNACSGASIADIPAQLAGVSPTTKLVTLTVGGIDAGSNDVLAACSPDPASLACQDAVTRSLTQLPMLAPKLAATYATIAATLPQARVVVMNYPRLFQPGILQAGDIVNQGTDALNAVIAAAVTGAANPRVSLVDVTQEFTNHGIGTRVPYIAYNPANPLATPNFHPNALGNSFGYVGALVHDRALRR